MCIVYGYADGLPCVLVCLTVGTGVSDSMLVCILAGYLNADLLGQG